MMRVCLMDFFLPCWAQAYAAAGLSGEGPPGSSTKIRQRRHVCAVVSHCDYENGAFHPNPPQPRRFPQDSLPDQNRVERSRRHATSCRSCVQSELSLSDLPFFLLMRKSKPYAGRNGEQFGVSETR